MRPKHRWVCAGREWSSPYTNLWRCEHCGVYKALGNPGKGGHCVVEYSTADGEVLTGGKNKGPPCERRCE